MEAFYSWIRNLTFYLIMVTVIINLLPSKKYEKYLRFFLGMVFLLLVIQPFTRGLRVEERIAYYFQTISLQNDANELRKELLGAEDVRLEQMFDRYEEAISEDIRQLADAGGFATTRIEVRLSREPDSQDFGKVAGIHLTVMKKDTDSSVSVFEEEREPVTPVALVEPVVIGQEPEENQNYERQEEQEDTAVGALRRQLLNYYDLEETDVKIQVQNRQG